MANWLKYVIAFASAIGLMLAFRALVFSIHGVTGNGLTPLFKNGDQLLVNRFKPKLIDVRKILESAI